MANFAVTARRAAGTNLTIATVGNPASSPKRARIWQIELSSRDVPVDQALNFVLMRCTALGTSTSVTPTPFDPADAAAVMLGGENHSVEPTYTAGSELLDISMNLKATYKWIALPNREIVIPATASNGIGLRSLAVSSGTPNVEAVIHFEE